MGLRVLTHNVLGIPHLGELELRVEAMCRTYTDLRPDWLILQEVHTRRVLDLFRSHLHFMPDFTTGGGRRRPAGGLVVFSRHPIETVGYMPFSNRYRDVGRGFAKGVLHWRSAGVEGVNVHLSCNPRANWTNTNRYVLAQRIQVELLIRFLSAISDPMDLLVLGDLNIPPGAPLYHELINGAKLRDPVDPGWTTFDYGKKKGARRLDHALVRGLDDRRLGVSQVFEGRTRLLPRGPHYVSDHRALLLSVN